MNDAAVERIIAYTRAQGGGTFDRDTLEPVTSVTQQHGYAVAVANGTSFPYHLMDIDGPMLHVTVEHDIRAVRDTWKGAPYIGTWFDPENVMFYIDPVVIIHDYFDAFAVARALGQKAVYSFGERKVLDV